MISRRQFLFTPIALAFAGDAPAPLLTGFRELYHLRFAEARRLFLAWQHDHPADPMGSVAEAASHLFEEFEHHGVLTTEFFLDDDRLLGGIEGKPDPTRTAAFHRANEQARTLAEARLKQDAKDTNALLALTLASGMHADYLSLIEKSQIASLREIRTAEAYGQRLLKVSPLMFDAYMALGAANYILSCLPAYKRAVLWFGGMQGDRQRGLNQLSQAARGGVYLAPYAKVMLALALVREKRAAEASRLMSELTAEFPESPLFARERPKIDHIAAQGQLRQ